MRTTQLPCKNINNKKLIENLSGRIRDYYPKDKYNRTRNLDDLSTHYLYKIKGPNNHPWICVLFLLSMMLFYFSIFYFLLDPKSILIFLLISMVFYYFYKKYKIIEYDRFTVASFNRNNKTITQYNKQGYKIIYKFSDYQPVYRINTSSQGGMHLTFMLKNKKTNGMITLGTHFDLTECHLKWAELQQFMDSYQPLPDTPEFESVRYLDNFTYEFDKKTKRDPRFWRKKNFKQIHQLIMLSCDTPLSS